MRRRTSRTTTALVTITAAAALLAGCSNDDGGNQATEPSTTQSTASEEPTTETPTSEEPTSQQPTAAPSDEPTADLEPFPDTTSDQSSDPTDAALLLVDVRVAEHEGFDRLVLEFEGDGEPGWQVGFVDSASTEGAGDPIQLEGDAILQVSATHTMPNDMSGYYDGPQQIDADLSSIEDVFVDGSFEGYTTVYLGLDEEVPFRVFTLTDPSRLVVDVPNADD